jgi:hypothetical protein
VDPEWTLVIALASTRDPKRAVPPLVDPVITIAAMPAGRLESLLAYVTAERRVCPMPGAWEKLRRVLGEGAPAPLILAAWGSPWMFKRWRVQEQIRFAAEHGKLGRVDRLLRSLPAKAWKTW